MEAVNHWSAQFGILWRATKVALSETAEVPMVCGLRHATIVLPAATIDWPAERLNGAIAHEIAHVYRRDIAWQLLTELTCAVYWINPLVWFAASKVRAEAEVACDDLTILHGVDPTEYAQTLVDVARSLVNRRTLPFGSLGMVHTSQVEHRVRSIIGTKRRRGAILLGVALATFMSIALLASAALVGGYHLDGYNHRIQVDDGILVLPHDIDVVRTRRVRLPDGTTVSVDRVASTPMPLQFVDGKPHPRATYSTKENIWEADVSETDSANRKLITPDDYMFGFMATGNSSNGIMASRLASAIVTSTKKRLDCFCAAGFGPWRTVKAIPIAELRRMLQTGKKQYSYMTAANGSVIEFGPADSPVLKFAAYDLASDKNDSVKSAVDSQLYMESRDKYPQNEAWQSAKKENVRLMLGESPRVDYFGRTAFDNHDVRQITRTFPLGSTTLPWADEQYLAIYDDGTKKPLRHNPIVGNGNPNTAFGYTELTFNSGGPSMLSLKHIREIDLQTRPYKFIVFKDLTPDPGAKLSF